jgi:GNAT superfamily N-acetyltransferase
MDIRRETYAGEVPQALAAALAAELLERYGGRHSSADEPPASDFDPPAGAFLVAYDNGKPAACGGVCRCEDGKGEIRRMYVVPEARRQGLARTLLAALEEEARRLGYTALRLETGNLQPEAIRLYESAAYRRIPRYGPYVDDERSVCFEKHL